MPGTASAVVGQVNSAAQSFVSDRFTQAKTYADDAWAITETFISDISSVMTGSETEFDYTAPTYNEETVELTTDIESKRPTAPTESSLTWNSGDTPTLGTLRDIPAVYTPSFPTLTSDAPSINFPDTPTVTDPTDPGDIPSMDDVDFPAEPSYTLPTLGSLQEITLPSNPILDIPEFSDSAPTADLVPPENMFAYYEAAYQSDVLDAVRNALIEEIRQGGTGLPAEIEEMLWDRLRSRQDAINERSYNEAEKYFSSRGWSIPPGALAARLTEARVEIARAEALLSNEIAIKQAELMLDNKYKSISAGLQLETVLTQLTNSVAQRALEAAKATNDAAQDVYKSKILYYNARLDAYKTAASVYESRLRGSLATLEVYKAQLEGVKLISEINKDTIEIYKARLSAVAMQIDVYSKTVDAASTKLSAEKVKIDAYRAKIDAYVAKINGNTSRYNLYQAQIAGEEAKVKLYAEQVKAYATEVEARKAEGEARNAQIGYTLAANDGDIKAFAAKVDEFKVIVGKEQARIDSIVRVYGSKVAMYEADTKVAAVDLDAQSNQIKMRIAQATQEVELLLKSAEVGLQNAARYHTLQVEALKTGASVAAQVTASAMSSVHAQASVGISGNASDSNSYNDSTSYDLTKSTPTFSHSYSYSS